MWFKKKEYADKLEVKKFREEQEAWRNETESIRRTFRHEQEMARKEMAHERAMLELKVRQEITAEISDTERELIKLKAQEEQNSHQWNEEVTRLLGFLSDERARSRNLYDQLAATAMALAKKDVPTAKVVSMSPATSCQA